MLKKLQVESLKWEDRTLDILEEIILNGNNKIPFHNIVLALLANQWNHSFLETYRCIEHLFHVIRLEEFYNVLNTPLTMLDVAREIEDKISWRPNEESAISDIFKEISNLHITSELEQVGGFTGFLGFPCPYLPETKTPLGTRDIAPNVRTLPIIFI